MLGNIEDGSKTIEMILWGDVSCVQCKDEFEGKVNLGGDSPEVLSTNSFKPERRGKGGRVARFK